MTDRIRGFTVVLKQDIREDDAEALLGLLRQSSWVQAVEPEIVGPGDWMVRQRVVDEVAGTLTHLVHRLQNPRSEGRHGNI